MAQGNGTTVNVYLGPWDVENLFGDVDDNGKGLIDLEQGDIVDIQASLLQSYGYGDSRGGGEINGVNASIGMSW